MMTVQTHRAAGVALTALLASLVAACAGPEAVEQDQVYQTPDGVAVVDTLTMVATITAIDGASRKVTLTSPDGKSGTFKAAKGVDLSAFAVGQQIAVQLTEAIALEIRRDGTPASDTAAVQLAAATDGQAGAIFEGEAIEVAARIVAIDAQTRQVTLQYADGTTKTIKAHKKVDLSGFAVGDTVTVEFADSMVIAIANPS
ncbi:MAG: hypothetical protein U1F08_14580 [Steroidobacteraceae bacterium]